MRFTSMPTAKSSSEASSAFASCDTIYSEESDDDCLVTGSRPPLRPQPVSPAVSKSRNSSWPFRSCGNSRRQPKQEQTSRKRDDDDDDDDDDDYNNNNSNRRPAEEDDDSSDCLGPDDSQQKLRKQWEAATLKRRTCPPMRSEGSKAGTYNWDSYAPQHSAREDSGTAETVQSNGHVSHHVSFQELSESTTSTSSDSVVQVEPREDGNAELDDEVVFRPATADQGLPESSGTTLKDSPLKNEFASCSMDVRKSVKRPRYEPVEVFDASWSLLKFRTINGTDGASTSAHVGVIDSLTVGNQCTGDSGVLEPASDVVVAQDLLGGREKLKETADFKLADEEEWARRQQELQKQAQEARRLRERKRAEADRKNEVELRQKQRLEEIRQIQQKEERNMGLKNQIRSKVQAELERLASGCRDMASLLRLLHIPVEGGICPSNQQVNAAYKKALLRFHPDRTSASVQGDPQRQVEAEETFKLITRMKQLLKPSSMIAMAAR